MALLYADENVPIRVVEELRRLGIDVLTAVEDGRANQSITDQDVLARYRTWESYSDSQSARLQTATPANARSFRNYRLH